MLKVSTFCSGIGSPEVAIKNLGIEHRVVFACEIDKYARQSYLANHECETMYHDMTKEDYVGEHWYSDINISGIPCQAFSLAGKRFGELDPRGLLFFDFYRYVKNQQPKYFIIENVKGLLSDNEGKTFQNWINLLGQSVNGDAFIFPHEDSLMYNLHWQVLNTKDYGLPQNRERVFLIGIRNDLPNSFVFPKGVPLKLRLKDILEDEVDEKYYLSETAIKGFINHAERHAEKGNGFRFSPTDGEGIAVTLTTNEGSRGYNNFLKVENIGNTNPSGNGMNGNVFSENGISPTLTTNKGEGIKIQISSATASGYEIATEGKRIAGWFENENVIGAYRDDAKRSSVSEHIYQKENSICNTIQCAHVPKVIQGGECNQGVIEKFIRGGLQENQPIQRNGICPTLTSAMGMGGGQTPIHNYTHDYRIRKLTPLECFRLQGFSDQFHQNAVDAGVSNSQLYKQAGNSISVPVIQAILKNLLT